MLLGGFTKGDADRMKWIDWYGPIALLGASKSAWKGWVVRRYS